MSVRRSIKTDVPQPNDNSVKNFLFALFFLSGMTALVYEIAWMRSLGLVLGNTSQAICCILAVFMGGLTVGAVVAGSYADSLKCRHLCVYGSLEILIAISALLATKMLTAAPEAFIYLNQAMHPEGVWLTISRLAICLPALLLPTIFMGATLPVLVKYLKLHLTEGESFFGLFYGMNLIGAAVGSILCAFVGFPFLGISMTVCTAAAINIIVGCGAIGLSFNPSSRDTANTRVSSTMDGVQDFATGGGGIKHVVQGSQAHLPPTLYLISALTGFSALGYEVLWSRLLRFYTTSSTYAFTLMVSSFLLGLAIGSFIFQKWLSRRITDTASSLDALGLCQYLAAFSSGLSLTAMPLAGLVITTGGLGVGGIFITPGRAIAVQATLALLFILGPAIMIGLSFPLIGAVATANARVTSRSVGAVYGINTLGTIFGSLCTGLLLVPLVGSRITFIAIIGISVITGAICSYFAAGGKRRAILLNVAIPIVVFVGFACVSADPRNDPNREALAKRLLSYGEDETGTVQVLQEPDGRLIKVNGATYASTQLLGLRYMRLLGHLPMLLHENPRQALNICYGTGTTAGAITTHPELQHLEVVDLSRQIIGVHSLFNATNNHALDRPTTHVQIADGRNYLLCTNTKYDVVSFEPPPPCEASVVNLYSKQFYQIVKHHLSPGGIMCQWIPMHLQSERLWKMMIQTAREVFSYVSVWEPAGGEAALIASDSQLNLDHERLAKRIQRTDAVKSNLAEIGLDSADKILGLTLISGEALNEYLSGTKAITDDRAQLEFFLPYIGPPVRAINVESFAQSRRQVGPAITPGVAKAQLAMHYLRIADNEGGAAHTRDLQQALQAAPGDPYVLYCLRH